MVWLFLPKYKENYETAYIYYLNIVIAGSSRVGLKEKKLWFGVQYKILISSVMVIPLKQ